MNKNSKEKTVRILVRAKPKYKDKIKKLAAKCNLSVSKYMVKKALGYEPRTVPPDAFYFFNEKTSELLNRELSPETEAAARKLFDDIYAEIIDMPKQSKKEIIRDVMTALPQSMLCGGGKEQPQSGKSVGAWWRKRRADCDVTMERTGFRSIKSR